MKRIQEKVKDIVEVRAYESLRDFTADPSQTISSYHFTDATSELMALWVDRIAASQTSGNRAFALAGYRGVGKSHFLATLGALVSRPDLRSRISDPRVSASSQRLSRRHYPVAYVRRGTHETLLDEFKASLAESLGTSPDNLGDSLTDILQAASAKAGELPFVLMIDTAFERGMRVARDDGPFLSEIADAAKDLNVFLGVALDDDIAGADGLNNSIVRSFTIDYLDQEHLYKVVNSHIFPKSPQMQPVLQNIYGYFREVLPHFRWSEQRFSSLYPLHPVILEVAPFVRLYVHDFALLSFASLAAERIMGRPANSLIALDEVFDSAEKGLRKVEDLEEAFEAYDQLNAEVVGKIPVMQRLQAKLILKALLLLSLDGEGTTAGEISAAMLIFDETEPERAVKTVHDLIKTFASALPEHVRITTVEGSETRYGFKVASKDNLNKALAESIAQIPQGVVERIVRTQFIDRFADCSFSADPLEPNGNSMECHTVWRGGNRRGRVTWSEPDAAVAAAGADTDWEVLIDASGGANAPAVPEGVCKIVWRPAALTREETETIQRYYALSTDSEIRETFSEQLRASVHSHGVAVEKIVNRLFLEDGRLIIDGFDYNCTEEARSAGTLAELFTLMLEPLFETRYPSHPYFKYPLGPSEVSAFITELYAGSGQHTAEFRKLADAFAMPLQVVRLHEGAYYPETEEKIAAHPLTSTVMGLVKQAGAETVSLNAIYAALRREPYGLVREAQHLLLSVLVGERKIEFVTSKGDRINRRSLDLQIIWEDIVGIARPAETSYSAKKLLMWARLLSNQSDLRSIDDPADVEKLKSSLREWLAGWKTARVIDHFNEVPDHLLNTNIWRLAGQTSKMLGAVADNISAVLDGGISIEEGLNRIAEAFSDSEDQLARAKSGLSVVEAFISGVKMSSQIRSYLACSEITAVSEIEDLREQLFRSCDTSFYNPSEASNRDLDNLWEKFRRDYGNHFSEQHDSVLKSGAIREKFEDTLRSDAWWEFENLSVMSHFDKRFWNEATALRRKYRELSCSADLETTLRSRPFCSCSFRLSDSAEWENLPTRLQNITETGLASYRSYLVENGPELAAGIKKLSKENMDPSAADAAALLARTLEAGASLPPLSVDAVKILHRVFLGAPENKILGPAEPVQGPTEHLGELVSLNF